MHCPDLQVMVATSVLSNSAQLKLSAENQTEVTLRYRELVKKGLFTENRSVTCTDAGLHMIDCTTFKVCVLQAGVLIGAKDTCAPLNFNPTTLECDPNYVCPPCTQAGFICLTNRSFRYCASAGVVVVNTQLCPSGYYCNNKCGHPCLNLVQNC